MNNLDNIPKEYHILFTTDWNNGNNSSMSSIQRGELNELHLKYNRYMINQLLNPVPDKIENEPVTTGFIKD